MSFKIAVLAVALLACQGNAQVLGGIMRPFISGYANGISEMAKPFIQLGQSVVSPATEYFGMKPGMNQYFSFASKPLAAAQSAVQEAQAAAQMAAQQAQLVAQSAVEQAEAVAKQAQDAALGGFQSVSSYVPGVSGSGSFQVNRPQSFGPESALQQAQAAAQSAAQQAQAAAKQAQAAALGGYQTISSYVPGVPGSSSVQIIRPLPFGPESAIQQAQGVAQSAAQQAQAAAKQAQAAALGGYQTVSSYIPGVPGSSSFQSVSSLPFGAESAIQQAQGVAQNAAKQAQAAAKQAQAAALGGYQTVSSYVPGAQAGSPLSFGAESAIKEAQAVAQAAAKQAQAAAQFAAQQAEFAAKTAVEQAKAHTLGKVQTATSLMSGLSNAAKLPSSQSTEVGPALRPRPYPLPMPSTAESEAELNESESHVPTSLLPEASGEFSAEGQGEANVPMTLEARGEGQVSVQKQ